MKKIQFNNTAQMWAFLQSTKGLSYTTDNYFGIAILQNPLQYHLDRAAEFGGQIL